MSTKRQKTKEILLLLAGMSETRSSKIDNCLCFAGEGLRLLEMLESVQCNYLAMSFTHQFEWYRKEFSLNYSSFPYTVCLKKNRVNNFKVILYNTEIIFQNNCPAGAFLASRYGTSCLKKSFRFPIMAALDDSDVAEPLALRIFANFI